MSDNDNSLANSEERKVLDEDEGAWQSFQRAQRDEAAALRDSNERKLDHDEGAFQSFQRTQRADSAAARLAAEYSDGAADRVAAEYGENAVSAAATAGAWFTNLNHLGDSFRDIATYPSSFISDTIRATLDAFQDIASPFEGASAVEGVMKALAQPLPEGPTIEGLVQGLNVSFAQIPTVAEMMENLYPHKGAAMSLDSVSSAVSAVTDSLNTLPNLMGSYLQSAMDAMLSSIVPVSASSFLDNIRPAFDFEQLLKHNSDIDAKWKKVEVTLRKHGYEFTRDLWTVNSVRALARISPIDLAPQNPAKRGESSRIQ